MEIPSNKNIEKKLKSLHPKPLSTAEKNRLWFKIVDDIEKKKQRAENPIAFFFFNRRATLAFLLVIALVGGATTVAAADSAKPGDILFPVDIAVEKVQLAFTSGNKKSTLRIKFAEERFSEAKLSLAAATDDSLGERATTTEVGLGVASSTSSTPSAGKKFSASGVERAGNALAVALDHLEETRSILEAEGNTMAVLVIDDVINDLIVLAENHVTDLDEFEIKTKNDNGKKIGVEIKASSNKIKTKFKFEQKIGNKGRGVGVGFKNRGEFTIEIENGDEDGDEGENDEDNENNDEDGDEDEDNGNSASLILSGNKIVVCHISPGNPSKQKTIRVGGRAPRAHLAHGDILGPCDGDNGGGNGDNGDNGSGNGTTTPDTISPVISNVASTSVGTTTASISWTTDENADSKVRYATSSPIDNAFEPGAVVNNTEETSHTISLSGLLPNTLYHYVVSSTDPSGNTATSSENSFTTESELVVDITAPIISNISATSTASTTTIIVWDTDEDSDSKIFYSTTTSFTIDETTLTKLDTTLLTNHSLSLIGLSASTTYHYIVTSTDLAQNTATSTEEQFTTQ